jgi:ankyrin repeat protein
LDSYLLSVGSPVNGLTTGGRTPLHYACEHGYIDIVRALIKSGANVNIGDKSGWTPIHLACLGAWPQHESHTTVTE